MEKPGLLRVAGFESESIVDGPGLRFTVFFQGCPHHCPGCHNPETHSYEGGRLLSAEDILAKVLANELLSGVTFSGGEPMEQASSLLPLAKKIREHGLNLVIFTGYLYETLLKKAEQNPDITALLSLAMLLVDGPFVLEKKSLELLYRGSSNQRLIDLPKSLASGKVVLWQSDFESVFPPIEHDWL